MTCFILFHSILALATLQTSPCPADVRTLPCACQQLGQPPPTNSSAFVLCNEKRVSLYDSKMLHSWFLKLRDQGNHQNHQLPPKFRSRKHIATIFNWKPVSRSCYSTAARVPLMSIEAVQEAWQQVKLEVACASLLVASASLLATSTSLLVARSC